MATDLVKLIGRAETVLFRKTKGIYIRMVEDISLEDIRKEQAEKAKVRDEAKKAREATGEVEIRLDQAPPRLNLEDSVLYAARPVISYDKFYSRAIHLWGDDGYKRVLCSDHYREHCPDCYGTKPKSGRYAAKPTMCGLFHIYNLVGETYSFEDKNGKTVSGPYKKFVRRIEIPFGDKDCNVKPIRAAAKSKHVDFMDQIFLFRRVAGKEGGWDIPEVIEEEELKEKLGREVTIALPSHSKAWNNLSARDLKILFMSDVKNVRPDVLFGPDPNAKLETEPVPGSGSENESPDMGIPF